MHEKLLLNPLRWHRLKDILADALEQGSSQERADTLRQACAEDVGLLRQAEKLLAQDTTLLESFAQFASAHLREDEADRIGERVGAYEITRVIGRGGMGAVYLGQRVDGQFDRQVAIKVLKRGTDTDEVLRRFRAERQILADLDYPFVTRLFDAGSTTDGLPYFVMEFVDGKPITNYVEQTHLGEKQTIELFVKICSAVEAAHRAGVIHRDIKPTNVLVKADGTPKLLDFGIAKLVHRSEGEENVTIASECRLTPRYAAPEQRVGAPASVATDVYALGVLLSDLFRERQSHRALPRIIRKATNADPAKRYSSAAALGAEITARLGSGLTDIVHRRRQRAKWAMLAGLISLIAAGLVLLLWDDLASRAYDMRRGTALAKPSPAAAYNGIHAIAVLPFHPLGNNDDILGLGMADAVISRMSALKQLRVLPTVAISRFNNNGTDVLQAVRSLGVDAVVTGTVQREGERVRVTVQLVNSSGSMLWSDKFDETLTDIFAIQDSISQEVARSLVATLTPEDQQHLEKHYTTDTAAYNLYLLGVSAYNTRTKQGLRAAIDYFDQAIKSDSHYALAYALMSDAYYLQSYYAYEPSAVTRPKAKQAAEKALALDSSLAEAHLAMSNLQRRNSFDAPGMQSLLRAIRLNPNFALAHQRYAWFLCGSGKLKEGVEEMRKAQALDPLSGTNSTALGVILLFDRRYPEALHYCERAAELNKNEPFIQGNLVSAYLANEKYNEALRSLHRMEEISPGEHANVLAQTAAVFALQARRNEADALMPELVALAQAGAIDPYNMTLLYTARGETDNALSWLDKPESIAFSSPGLLRYDPQLDPIRSDPRFAAILKKHDLEMTAGK